MRTADQTRLARAFAATWPAASTEWIGPFLYRDGAGGGSRVSAATLEGDLTPEALNRIEDRFAQTMRDALFQVRAGEETLDAMLAARGYRMFDPVVCLTTPLDSLLSANPKADPKDGYAAWPPLAIQREIWAAGGIGPARIDVMERVTAPKCTLLGRLGDVPAGTAFVAVDDGIAMVHALEVAPAARRKGLARKMMSLAANWARAQGAKHLALQVTRANTAAISLYSSLGMREADQYHYRATPYTELR